jgi:hypothetical protein
LKLQSSNLEIGIEMKLDRVMNGLAIRSFLGAKLFVFSITNLPAVRCISTRMPLPSGLLITFRFHNNEREKVVLEPVIARNEAIPSNLSIDLKNDFLKLKYPRCKRYDCALNYNWHSLQTSASEASRPV